MNFPLGKLQITCCSALLVKYSDKSVNTWNMKYHNIYCIVSSHLCVPMIHFNIITMVTFWYTVATGVMNTLRETLLL